MANDFYQHSGHPGTRAPRSSALLRAEFAAIEDGFDKLPDVGTANLFSVSDGSALVGKTAAQAKVILALENVTNTADADKPISTLTQAALDLKAPLASPALTGTPTAPTADAGDSSTTVATTAFVASGLALKANLDSPALTGTPTAPTQEVTDSSDRLATTAFVKGQLVGSKSSSSGYLIANGILFQWVTAVASTKTPTVTYPIAFPNNVTAVLFSLADAIPVNWRISTLTSDLTKVGFIREDTTQIRIYVLAIGY